MIINMHLSKNSRMEILKSPNEKERERECNENILDIVNHR